jgi:hypothetical protein
MKLSSIPYIFCITIWSCSNPTDNNLKSADNLPVEVRNDSFVTSKIETAKIISNIINKDTSIERSKVQIDSNFPFGCIELSNFKYPKKWTSTGGDGSEFSDKDEKELKYLSDCFHNINHGNSMLTPKVEHLEILKIGTNYKNASHYFDTLAIKSIENCKFRLPRIGIYHCYYFFQESKTHSYGDYGNLLLLDTLNRKGKLLNIYYDYGGDQSVSSRYFLIDKNVINLYGGSCYDDGCGLSETFRIKISQEGKVEIARIQK